MDDSYSLLRMATALMLIVLVMGGVILTLSSMDNIFESGTQELENGLQVIKQEAEAENVSDPVTEYFKPEMESSITEVVKTTFNSDFIKHNNPRVSLDEILLNSKAQELFEQKAVQLYVITVDTKKEDNVEARKEASKQASKISDDYKVVLTITDNGTFWFYGDYVNDFLTADDKLELSESFAKTYNVEPLKPFKLNTYVVCTVIVCVALIVGTSIHKYLNVQKRKAEAVILNTKLEKMTDEVDELVDKYKDDIYDSAFKQ